MRDRTVFPGLLICLFVSGASGLIYEVAWVRSLELVFGATSFAIATVLAAFMGGLALGSWLMGMAAARLERYHPLRVYAAIELLIGVAGSLVPPATAGASGFFTPATPWAPWSAAPPPGCRFFPPSGCAARSGSRSG